LNAAEQVALSKNQSLKHHIWSKISVVGYPKTIKFHGSLLLCCPCCSDMFIGNKNAFFSQHMNEGKSGGLSKKTIFCASYLLYNYGCGL